MSANEGRVEQLPSVQQKRTALGMGKAEEDPREERNKS